MSEKRKKVKKEKKKKKDKKHKKEKHRRRRSRSNSSDDWNRKNKSRKSESTLIRSDEIKREQFSIERQVGPPPEKLAKKDREGPSFSFSKFTSEKYDEDRSFYAQKKEAEKYIQERYGRRKEVTHYDQAERDFVKKYEEAERLRNKEPERKKMKKDDSYVPRRYQ